MGLQIIGADGSTGTFVVPSDLFPTGAWHHVAFAYNASSRVWMLYKNGVEIIWTNDANAITPIGDIGTTVVNLLGKGHDGLLSDVRIYDGTLSSAEVASIASSPVIDSCAQPAQLKASYALLKDAKDSSGNNFHGTLINGDASSFECGYLNLFSDQDQYIDLGSAIGNMVADLTSYSVSAWVTFRSFTAFSR